MCIENIYLPVQDKDEIITGFSRITSTQTQGIPDKKSMSEKASGRKKASKRPPVPCPKLPASFRANKHDDTSNYSYASVEFRPVIITDEGAVTAPVDQVSPADRTDGFNHDFNVNNEEYLWDDEMQACNSFDAAPYAEMQPNPTHGELQLQSSEAEARGLPMLPPRENDDRNVTQIRESDIYDIPVDMGKHQEVDVSQLYAVVDFNQKRTSQKKNVTEEINRNGQHIDVDVVEEQVDGCTKSNQQSTAGENGQSIVGKSKFFVEIPDKRAGAPPPVPKPYSGKGCCYFCCCHYLITVSYYGPCCLCFYCHYHFYFYFRWVM